jgi:hypothetical protein
VEVRQEVPVTARGGAVEFAEKAEYHRAVVEEVHPKEWTRHGDVDEITVRLGSGPGKGKLLRVERSAVELRHPSEAARRPPEGTYQGAAKTDWERSKDFVYVSLRDAHTDAENGFIARQLVGKERTRAEYDRLKRQWMNRKVERRAVPRDALRDYFTELKGYGDNDFVVERFDPKRGEFVEDKRAWHKANSASERLYNRQIRENLWRDAGYSREQVAARFIKEDQLKSRGVSGDEFTRAMREWERQQNLPSEYDVTDSPSGPTLIKKVPPSSGGETLGSLFGPLQGLGRLWRRGKHQPDSSTSDPRVDTVFARREKVPGFVRTQWEVTKGMWRELRNITGYMETLNQRRTGPWVEILKKAGRLPAEELKLREVVFAFRDALRRRQQIGIDAIKYRNKTLHWIVEPLQSVESRVFFEKLVAMKHLTELGRTPIGKPAEIKRQLNRVMKAADAFRNATTAATRRSRLNRWVREDQKLHDLVTLTPLPEGLTSAELAQPLRELMAKATPDVLEAFRRHEHVTVTNAIEGVHRGYLPPEVLQSGTYFPHMILEYSSNHLAHQPYLSDQMRKPFRPFSQRLRGSGLRMSMDYQEAMGAHLQRFHLANAIEDFATEWLPKLDGFRYMAAKGPAGKIEYENLFRRDDGTVPRPQDLDTGHIEEWRGEPWEVVRFTRTNEIFGARLPKSPFDALLYNLTAVGEKQQTYFVPKRVADFMKHEHYGQDLALLQDAMAGYVKFWKSTQIMGGGFPTRALNTFGDLVQLYLEDTPAMLTLLRVPTFMRILLTEGKGRPDIQRYQQLIERYRVGEGATFFGSQGRYLRGDKPWRQMTKVERSNRLYGLPGDLVTGLNWVANAAEVWPRIAKFVTDLDRIERGRTIKSKVFDIKGLEQEAAAAHLARNIFVDYEAVSPFYRRGVRTLFFPFITWFHRTTNYHARYIGKGLIEAPVEAAVKPSLKTVGQAIMRPVETVAKYAVPALAMWYWNNIHQRESEENIGDWVKTMPHITLPWRDPDDPSKQMVLILPTGADLFFNFLRIPDLMENAAEWHRSGRKDIFEFKGFSDIFMFMAKMFARGGKRLLEMAPIGEAITSLATGIDTRTGKQVVPEGVTDPDQRLRHQMWYMVKKSIPVLDRIYQQFEKDMDRIGQDADLRNFWERVWQATFVRGRYNPDPRVWLKQAFAYPQDIDLGRANRIKQAERMWNAYAEQNMHDFEEALGQKMAGNDAAMQEWFSRMKAEIQTEGRIPFDPENLVKRFTDVPQFMNTWQRVLRRQQLEAPTPEMRERARKLRMGLRKMSRWEGAISGRGVRTLSKTQAFLDELKKRGGIVANPPTQYGEELGD